MSTIEVTLTWDDEPAFTVDERDGVTTVHASCALSESQVAAACASLDGNGPAVLAAWRSAVGLTPAAAPHGAASP
ncbi:MAG: hypothetical protein KGP10_06475 [Actinomycetales bacterium]|nr:hypothetical protein [Actinomycetales bacterium]